jgi:large subunit ribosomal protein L15
MYLNTIMSAPGARKPAVRLGRGIGSGVGKTCGKGHKGQKARSGGYHKVGFEGGQMPIQRRLPKFGFYSHLKTETAEVRLVDLSSIPFEGPIDIALLKDVGVIGRHIKYVKVILKGSIDKAVHLKGLKITKGARALVEAAGGQIEE